MQLNKNTANAFISYLKSHGYPDEAFAVEWGNKNCRVDIAILDVKTKAPIAFYEIKGAKTQFNIDTSIMQLEKIAGDINIPVSCGIVFSKTSEPYFEYCDISDAVYRTGKAPLEDMDILSQNDIPTKYRYKATNTQTNVQQVINRKKKDSLITMNRCCWIGAPFLSLALILLDRFQVLLLTTERMVVYGVCILILFVPFISEIKFGDYSISMKSDDSKEKKK